MKDQEDLIDANRSQNRGHSSDGGGGGVSVRAAAEGGREGGRGLSVCLDPEPPAWVSRAPQVPPSEPPPNPDAWCVPGLCASCLRPAGRLAARVLLSV